MKYIVIAILCSFFTIPIFSSDENSNVYGNLLSYPLYQNNNVKSKDNTLTDVYSNELNNNFSIFYRNGMYNLENANIYGFPVISNNKNENKDSTQYTVTAYHIVKTDNSKEHSNKEATSCSENRSSCSTPNNNQNTIKKRSKNEEN